MRTKSIFVTALALLAAACVSLAASTFVSAHADESGDDGKLHVSSIEELCAGENLSELEKPYTGEAIVDDYGRVVGSELNGEGFYYMNGVAFDDSYVSPSLSDDGKTWTIDGVSASMTAEQLEAFWVCDAAECDPTEYVSIAIVGAYGETVECHTDDGSLLFSMTVANAGGTCHIVIIDVTERRGDFSLTLKIYESGVLKEESKIVLGTIYSSSSPINGACNYIVLDDDLEGTLEVDGLDLNGDPSPFAALFIDLNGHEWTSSSDATLKVESSDVSVFVYDSEGDGVIDCTASNTSAIEIYSGASLYLYGGTVTRSCDESFLRDDGEVENSSSGWYVINNHGNLYIYDGAVETSGVYSALVKNGWKSSGTDREDFYDAYASTDAYTYIEGGAFEGGKYAFKNDSHAAAAIYGGDFSNHRLAAADNAGDGDLYVYGGAFSCDGPSGAELRNRGDGSIYIEDDAFEGSVCVLSGSVFVGDEEFEADQSGEPVYVDIYEGETSSYVDHDWDEGTVTTEPQCTVKGERTYICSVCGETYTEEIQILGHLAGNPQKFEATCEEGAYTVYECLRDGCSETLYRYTSDPLGHDWSETEYVCRCDKETEGDYFYSVCSVCGKEDIEYTETWTHSNYVSFIVETATCDNPGSIVSFCADCGEWSYDEIAALGHDYVSYISLQPSCEIAGETTFVCLNCGDTYTEPVETSGHTIAVTHIETTCESEGRDIEWCSVCGEVFSDTVTPATGHRWGSWTVTRSATCTANMIHTRTCSVCGATDGGEVENSMTDHIWAVSSQKAASCEEAGYVNYKCSYCGATKTETTLATGHSYEVYQSDAYIEVYCSDCGDILLSYDIPIYEASSSEDDKAEAETDTEAGAFVPDEDVTVNGDDGPSAPSENESESSVTVGGSAEDITESSSKPYVWLIIVCICAVIIIAVALWLGYRSYKKSKVAVAEGGEDEDEKTNDDINEDKINEDDRSDEDEGE